MTLILSFANRLGVIQVVDRLLIKTKQDISTPFDRQSNKTLVYAARDAVVIISYTGLGYVDDIPTDQWMAQTLIGRPLAVWPDGRPWSFQSGKQENWPSFGNALKRLRDTVGEALRKWTSRNSQSSTLKIVIAGWQFYRSKRPRPLTLTAAWEPVTASCTIDSMPRHIGRGACLQIEPDGHLTEEEQTALFRSLRGKDAVGMEREMTSAIRLVAARSAIVGPDCICVTLPHPSARWARIRYDSQTPQHGALIASTQSIVVPIAFFPWIITEGFVQAPSVVSGPSATETQVGPYRLRIEGTGPRTNPSQPLAFQESQQRPWRPMY